MVQITIEEKLTGLETARNTIRAKLVELGLAESSAKLEALATIIAQMVNRGAVNDTVDGITTTSVTIEKGYTDGGTVTFDDSKIMEMLSAI